MNTLDYYFREREIAFDPLSPAHILPRFRKTDKVVLDIGGGMGDTLAASRLLGHLRASEQYVLDTNRDAIMAGYREYAHIMFVHGYAEKLPFCKDKFDCVVSRVSLPYTNIPVALSEIYRTLKPGGHVWLTMHSLDKLWFDIKLAWRQKDFKALVVRSYVAMNGLCFNWTGRVFKLGKRMESWQSERGMYKALLKAGFVDPVVLDDDFFVCEARKAL